LSFVNLNGKENSGVSVFNLSYQLYPNQTNRISGGQLNLVSVIRNRGRETTEFVVEEGAHLRMTAYSFGRRPDVVCRGAGPAGKQAVEASSCIFPDFTARSPRH
jgi:hypothetical protein